MPRGIYIKTKEHCEKIRDTLKRKGIKPIISSPSHWLGKKRIFKDPEKRKNKISLMGIGRFVSLETRKKFSEKRKGNKHWNWKKDRNLLIKSDKKHLDGKYREWMFSVKNRDNWKCRISNSDCKGRLESHHILNWKEHPKLRYEINNGITLCHAHHPRGRIREAELSPYFQELVAEKQ